jgi:hypothetical protein
MSVTPMRVQIQLTEVGWGAPGSGRSGGQVYLWTVFFKIDGDKVSLGQNLKLQGTATVVAMPGNHGDLGSNDFGLNFGTLTIPANVGRYGTVLHGIPILGSLMSGVIGCVGIMMLQLDTPDDAISAGHNALNTSIQQQLDSLIPTFGLTHPPTPATILADIATLQSNVQSAIIQAVANALSDWQKLATWLGFSNQDEQLMTAVFLGVQDSGTPLPESIINLANVPPQGTPLSKRVAFPISPHPGAPPIGEEVYHVDGLVMAAPFPVSLKWVLNGLGHTLPVNLGRVVRGSFQSWLNKT